ncbi:M20/M25/M40 family metallo-hydrolase [Pseudobacteriovorax antillogorgiicola]|uniref:M20/M25/M40 family metallo-hydrolase n=1 Tax=Pseudobacteriovorax antillogorgiicola TaxID=1513793 RepID=UPI001A9F9D1C|nr:M20/M25/M40 family metallo-hydrolase [Pseudobacteriovorax antillogorgiicola]
MIIFIVALPAMGMDPSFSFETQANGRLIWKDAQTQLFVSQQTLRQQDQLISVIKFPSHSNLLDLVPSERILARRTYDFYFDIAAISSSDLRLISSLAPAIHQLGGQCGLIETFPLNRQLTQADNEIAPVYSSLATLDAPLSSLESIDQDRILSHIETLVNLGTRFHTTGTVASETVSSLMTAANTNSLFTIEAYEHDITSQNSVIARLTGTSLPEETIVIGAHLDSINNLNNSDAPGADDDASGVAILVEMIQVINSLNLSFARTIELQAYAAEEVGLWGSGDIADDYVSSGKAVVGAMQIDMTMYGPNGEDPTIFLVETDTSRDLRRSAVNLIKNYLDGAYSFAVLSRGTSDHKSWSDRGVPALFGFESIPGYNPYIHSSLDTSSQFNNYALNLQISKLALLFLHHYAGVNAASSEYASEKESLFSSAGSDIALAISSGIYLAAGTSTDVATVELCQIDEATQSDCSQERLLLEQFLDRGTRRIFYGEQALDLAAGQKWRVWAYDQGDDLLQKRDIVLSDP